MFDKLERLIRFGVIGLGVGWQHALRLESMKGAELVALCDRDPEVLGRARDRFPTATGYGREDQLLAEAGVDAIVVASYDNEHAATIVRALAQGVHVFAEKPLGTTQVDLEAISQALEGSPSSRLTTNTLLRRSPRFVWLKEQIDKGDLGRVFHAELDYLYGRLEKLTDGWRGKDPNYSVTLGGAIHMVDLLMWLTGERPSSVTAVGSSLGLRASSMNNSTGFTGHDLRVALLEFPSGMTAKISANFACVMPHFHRVEVFGTEGTFFNVPYDVSDAGTSSTQEVPGIRSVGAQFQNRDPEILPRQLDLPYPAVPKGILLPQFASAISGTGELAITEQEALDVTSVCLAIDQSARHRVAVQVEYVLVTARQRPNQRVGEAN